MPRTRPGTDSAPPAKAKREGGSERKPLIAVYTFKATPEEAQQALDEILAVLAGLGTPGEGGSR